jgi:metal-dependent amidase/aminoacylase/carboxypeptidase family protein
LPRIRDWHEGFYRDFHKHPELSHQEFETARKVADRLRGCGFKVHDGIGGIGVIGVLDNGSRLRVLFRADMDALPVQEAIGLDYASTARATDADGNEVPGACLWARCACDRAAWCGPTAGRRVLITGTAPHGSI